MMAAEIWNIFGFEAEYSFSAKGDTLR